MKECVLLYLCLASLTPLARSAASIYLLTERFAVKEGEQFTVNVQKTGVAATEVSVAVEVDNPAANGGNDFIGHNHAVVFPSGRENVTLSVKFTVRDDGIPEREEHFKLKVLVVNGDAQVGDPSTADVIILDNDDAFGIFSFTAVSPVVVEEDTAETKVRLNIQRFRGTFGAVVLSYQVLGELTAEPGIDILPATGSLVFEDGAASKHLVLLVQPDEIPEGDEKFTVRITSAVPDGVVSNPDDLPTVNQSDVRLIIKQNDAPIRFAQSEYRVDEQDFLSNLHISIHRGLEPDGTTVIGPVDLRARVTYLIVPGSAKVGEDYNATNGSLTFNPGTTVSKIMVSIKADQVPETEEWFKIILANPSGDTVLAHPKECKIIINANDDHNGIISFSPSSGKDYPVISINEDTTSEVMDLRVVRNGGTFGTVSVQWVMSRNSSGSGEITSDLSPIKGTVIFAPGQREKPIVLMVTQDTDPEPAERFTVRLLPDSIRGGARTEGIIEAHVIIQDSDDAYGVVEFSVKPALTLDTFVQPRRLKLAVSRTGGLLGDVRVHYKIEYILNDSIRQGILNETMPSSVLIPAGDAGMSFTVNIKDDAFLKTGAEFQISLVKVELADTSMKSYNSPRLGQRSRVDLPVTAELANGEVGFTDTSPRTVGEPEGNKAGPIQLLLGVSREGTQGEARVYWNLSGIGDSVATLTETDVTPLSGMVTLKPGQSQAAIVLEVHPDDIPETDEQFIILLTHLEPASMQRLLPGAARVTVTIPENDNPGGVFQFSEAMSNKYTLKEVGNPNSFKVMVSRSVGSLVTRSVEYFIEPNGEVEFYGGIGVIKFAPGELQKNTTIVARHDGVPELIEHFTLGLRSHGDKEAIIGSRNSISISVLENDDPYGVFQFPRAGLRANINESKGELIHKARLTVQRKAGRFSEVNVSWIVVNGGAAAIDISPTQGSLQFYPGQGDAEIVIQSLPDELPESGESFEVRLTKVTGKAKLGSATNAFVHVNKNDDDIHFKEPSTKKVPEAGQVIFTVVREGEANYIATVLVKTVEDEAGAGDREADYEAISGLRLVFGVGEREKNVTLTTLEDDVPETDEKLKLQLYNTEGDVVLYSKPTAIAIIEANDDANGIFHFSAQNQKEAQEGKPVSFEVVRDRGRFSEVQVHLKLYHHSNKTPVAPQTDFMDIEGTITFSDQQHTGTITVVPAKDKVPEFSEKFELRLVNVTGGGPSGEVPKLAATQLMALIDVELNDDPYGVFSVAAATREVGMAEDFIIGNEDSTRTEVTIERKQGAYTQVQVAWELFSYQIAGAGNLPEFVDLLFLGSVSAGNVTDSPMKRRPGTGTKVLGFSGKSGSYLTVEARYQPSEDDIEDGFSVSAWLQVAPLMTGCLLSKTSANGAKKYYTLRLKTVPRTFTVELTYSTKENPTSQAVSVEFENSGKKDQWSHVLVNVESGQMEVYFNGVYQGSGTLESQNVDDGDGMMFVGACDSKSGFYQGYMQDVRIFSRKLDLGEIEEVYTTPSVKDVTPISGYLTFNEGQRAQQVELQSLDDSEEEPRDVFALKLISASGGARLSQKDAIGVVTVLKSDTANGLFGFSGPCAPYHTDDEAAVIYCPIEREKGDTDTVTLTWTIINRDGQLAEDDFVNATGQVEFTPGERLKSVMIQVQDEDLPELTEHFDVIIAHLEPGDGLVGSTNYSGAVINPATQVNNITVADTDYPYGLIQFTEGEPQVNVTFIKPRENNPKVLVKEEAGYVELLVVRSQGTTGTVAVEWRTMDGTARSSGQSLIDFEAGVDTIFFEPGQQYVRINITILDNRVPEDNKFFKVQLVNPKGGAAIGPASVITVTIQHSDHAYGVFQFDKSSLFTETQETRDTGFSVVNLRVIRTGGSIKNVTVIWGIDDPDDDFMEDSGEIIFGDGQTVVQLTVKVRGETVPELDETFHVKLLEVSAGDLGKESEVQASITIFANDETYGVFIIAAEDRPTKAEENTTAVVRVRRHPMSGTFGEVEVTYSTLQPTEKYGYMPQDVVRANFGDFYNTQGRLVFKPGIKEMEIEIPILDDDLPESDETIFVRLLDVKLLRPDQSRPVSGSPRLGTSIECYGQVIIQQNDNANGILELSLTSVTVDEGIRTPFLHVIRKAGSFGEVTVKFQVEDGSATYGLDYKITSDEVKFLPGQTEVALPLEIIDDLIPELAETFIVQLLDQLTGGATLGALDETRVTIAASDDPYGNFGFEGRRFELEEPEGTEGEMLHIPILRLGGTLGVISVTWQATMHGKILSDRNESAAPGDIYPSAGVLSFVSNEARRNISIKVLPDELSEGREDILIRLESASNGGRIDEDRNGFILSILPSDDPHGTVQLASDTFTIKEERLDSLQVVTVNRSGGIYGQLHVFYHTERLDLVAVAEAEPGGALGYFQRPFTGRVIIAGTPINVENQEDPFKACYSACLLAPACQAFEYNSTTPSCRWFPRVDTSSLDTTFNDQYYIKILEKAMSLYSQQATPGLDYSEVVQSTITIPDGVTTGHLPVTVRSDDIPELPESFMIFITGVDLVGGPPRNLRNIPKLGEITKARVYIARNDFANGRMRIRSNDPRATKEGSLVLVEERDKFSTELIVERLGGSIGTVHVDWIINETVSNATQGVDFVASGATLSFGPGETSRTIRLLTEASRTLLQSLDVLSIGIRDDDMPENDETAVVQLTSPMNGATLDAESQVTIVVMANDYVAGLMSFDPVSYLATEGTSMTVTVTRSQPALGVVTADWRLVPLNNTQPANKRFLVYEGSLIFQEGETRKTVQLAVLQDDQPKINQEYAFRFVNITTAGVRQTGKAAADPHNPEALITVEGGNYPHGLFTFAPTSLLYRVPETNHTAYITVDRKFGNIGKVQLFYKIFSRNGSTPFDASPGLDFVAEETSVIIQDGQGSVSIPVQILEDDLPEIDEKLSVQLTSVQLLVSPSTTFLPKLGETDIRATLVIEANDGTKGEVIFPPGSANVRVQEEVKEVTLTVQRSRGTFGNVSVFCFAQTTGDGAQQEKDFRFQPRELYFLAGQKDTRIKIEILDDNSPEPAEKFEIILASPKHGLTLGDPYKAIVTIAESDAASGYVTFTSAEPVTLNEPTRVSQTNSRAVLELIRAPGIYGVVNVPFKIEAESGEENITDLYPTSGFITFADREGTASVEVTVLPDDMPEEREVFTMILLEPDNGAALGTITRRPLVIERNDSPFGLLQIYPAGTLSNSSYDVEEGNRTLYFDIIRSQGSMERISVDATTRPVSATFLPGSKLTVLPFQEIKHEKIVGWYSFSHQGAVYALMLSSARQAPLSTEYGTDGATKGGTSGDTMLYRWQGMLSPVQSLETDSAIRATSFIIKDQQYLFVLNQGNQGRRSSRSRLYQVLVNGKLNVVQDLLTTGGTDATFFTKDHRSFLLITNYEDNTGQTNINSHLYEWDTALNQFSGSPVQYLSTAGAAAAHTMVIDDEAYVVIANYFNSDEQQFHLKAVAMYAVVHFIKENAVEAVPKSWLSGANLCKWPPFKASALTKAIERRAPPEPEWNLYSVEVLKLTEDYEKARTKAKRAVNRGFSEMSSTDDNSKRKRVPAKKLCHSEEEEQPTPTEGETSKNLETSQDPPLSDSSDDIEDEPAVKKTKRVKKHHTLLPPPPVRPFPIASTSRTSEGPDLVGTKDMLPASQSQASTSSRSGIYKMDENYQLVVEQQIETIGATDITSFKTGSATYMIIASSRSSPEYPNENIVVYRWDETQKKFSAIQKIRATGVNRIHTFKAFLKTYLVSAGDLAKTCIYEWDMIKSQFFVLWVGPGADDLYPLVLQQPAEDVPELVVLAEAGREQADTGKADISQMALTGAGDFVPRTFTMIFESGQTELQFAVTILDDKDPEDTETFSVALTNPRAGAELGMTDSVTVNILANDNAYGIIEFAEDSYEKKVEELEYDNIVTLSLVRSEGLHGRVVVKWMVTGDHKGLEDLTPVTGLVEFANGQSTSTLNIAVKPDSIAESDETSIVSLVQVVQSGTHLDDRAAKIGTHSTAKLIVLANDSPHGVVRWEKRQYTAIEPLNEAAEVVLNIVRDQGTLGTIQVDYVTSQGLGLPSYRQAVAGRDFKSVAASEYMADGIVSRPVKFYILPDDDPELPETFYVNITGVQLIGAEPHLGARPSVHAVNGTAAITIPENDDPQGIIEFRVARNIESRVDVYEGMGVLRLKVGRTEGSFNTVVVSWQAAPREATVDDFSPTGGTVVFLDGVYEAYIEINIIDDNTPEPLQTFDVQLLSVVSGGATIGKDRSVRVGIVKNDSPTGTFSFVEKEVEIRETDSVASLVVQRRGLEGSVNVHWRLSADALNDFLPPYTGVLVFSVGEAKKTLELRPRSDNELEGRESFTVSLVSADSNADISPSHGDCTVTILPDPGATGTIAVVTESRKVYVGEPSDSYDGKVKVTLTRGHGVFGKVRATWQLVPRDITTFVQTQGQVLFPDQTRLTDIIIQTRDDSVPEERRSYTLQLTTATDEATIDPAGSTAEIVVAASDYPFGIFEFEMPPKVETEEDSGKVELVIIRKYGTSGSVKIHYKTFPGTATSDPMSSTQDYLPVTGEVVFTAGERRQKLTVTIMDDALAEGPEFFYVNITEVQLLAPRTANFSRVGAVQLDMPPDRGPLAAKTVVIMKNDNAEGFIQFSTEALGFVAHERDEIALVPLLRGPGHYGNVSVTLTAEGRSAVDGVDFRLLHQEVLFADGQKTGTVNVSILNDLDMEFEEHFILKLLKAGGGAALGPETTATVTIAKSDYPNGKFGFQGHTELVIDNPPVEKTLTFTIERRAGQIGKQTLKWRLMGPNNPTLTLQDTSDISHKPPDGTPETTEGSLVWEAQEGGWKTFTLSVKPYTDWEIQKTYVVMIYDIQGFPADLGHGEVDPKASNVTLVIRKYGHPNGIVRFAESAQVVQTFTEPERGETKFTLPLVRTKGTTGVIKVSWQVSGPGDIRDDISAVEGITTIPAGFAGGTIELSVLADDTPELSETFTVYLMDVEGGAEIDTVFNTSSFIIKYNDYPHGHFFVDSDHQGVLVNPSDLSRYVLVNVTRLAGNAGMVRVTFSLTYDEAIPGTVYLSSATGTVTFQDGQSISTEKITIKSGVFIGLGSKFTLTLTGCNYIGADVTMEPELIENKAAAKIIVPAGAANSEAGFYSKVLLVDEENQDVNVTLYRLGSYGDIIVDWKAGYPEGRLTFGYNNGIIRPDTGSIRMAHQQDTAAIIVTVYPSEDEKKDAFALHLTELKSPVGAARMRVGYTLTEVEPHGLIQFSPASREVGVEEGRTQVQLTIERVYGSQGPVMIRYSTVDGTATEDSDYGQVVDASVRMEAADTTATINIQIKRDAEPEEDEHFFVNLTSVTLLPTIDNTGVSPRLSNKYSLAKVIIRKNSDPYGVISISTVTGGTETSVEESGSVPLVVHRTGGNFGTVSVKVRTIGGKEAWDDLVDPTPSPSNETIGEALGNRESDKQALAGQDYQILDFTVTFQKDAPEQAETVKLEIINDRIPENDEEVFVYVTEPVGGARIARPSKDNGRQGYVKVTITRNDLWGGNIGFYPINSSHVEADEDAGTPATFTIQRRNSTFGDITVRWRAVSGQNNKVPLSEQLVQVSGTVSCPARQTFCTFTVHLKQDMDPENETTIRIELVSAAAGNISPGEPGVTIDPARKYATMVIKPSDHPQGLVQFSLSSRYIFVDKEARLAGLKVERVGFKDKHVTISYSTEQQTQPGAIAGVKVFHALEGADFTMTRGTLTFTPGKTLQEISVELDPFTASDNPYPKMFKVSLSSPTGGVEVGVSVAVVTITSSSELPVWTVWSLSLQQLENNTIRDLADKLLKGVQETMDDTTLTVTKTLLDKMINTARTRSLTLLVQESMMKVFCALLDPSRRDVTRGHWQLSEVLERFALSFLANSSCGPANDIDKIKTPECQYVKLSVARLYPRIINGYTYTGRNGDFFKFPSDYLKMDKTGLGTGSDMCRDVYFIEYFSEQWFTAGGTDLLLNTKVLSMGVDGTGTHPLDSPVQFRIHTPGGSIAAKQAVCQYFNERQESWTTGDDVCSVVNNLAMGIDNYVECSCRHMSSYSVRSEVRSPNMIGYPIWFFISCFICIGGLALAILAHHVCVMNPLFAAGLLMHMCFACLATQTCYVVDAYLSPGPILNPPPGSSNYRCIVMALFLHYFWLAQFTWMFVQAYNFWKILVMNDEHTDRKYMLYFLLGWGLPVVLVAVFYIVAFCIYRFVVFLPVDTIYGDVNNNKDICFLTNPYTALAGLIGPAIICLMHVGVVFIHSFQVAQQWQAYDDMYKGRYNIHEVRTLLVFWALIILTWLWGGLHMVYSQFWMLIIFCVFNIAQGMYAFVVYAVLRNPCMPCINPVKVTYKFGGGSAHPGIGFRGGSNLSVAGSDKGSQGSLPGDLWDREMTPGHRKTEGPVYVHPPAYDNQAAQLGDSQDFDDLIYALKTGAGPPTRDDNSPTVDTEATSDTDAHYEMRRISIADTHL